MADGQGSKSLERIAFGLILVGMGGALLATNAGDKKVEVVATAKASTPSPDAGPKSPTLLQVVPFQPEASLTFAADGTLTAPGGQVKLSKQDAAQLGLGLMQWGVAPMNVQCAQTPPVVQQQAPQAAPPAQKGKP